MNSLRKIQIHGESFAFRDDAKVLAPLEASEYHKRLGYKHDCPKCHCSLGYKEKKAPSFLPRWMRKTILYEVCQPYCGFCGQKIDWSRVA